MGNRAIITTKNDFLNNGIGIYLHWNGGRDSVEAFLKYCELKKYRSPDKDNYGYARLCQVIGNFFGGSLSIGIERVDKEAGLFCDNGCYIIENWEIVDRKNFHGYEQQEYDLQEMLLTIDGCQPKSEQIHDLLIADSVQVKDLKIGDTVIQIAWDDNVEKLKIVGFGEDKYVNGTHVLGIPYTDKYSNIDDNINNYISPYDKNAYVRVIKDGQDE